MALNTYHVDIEVPEYDNMRNGFYVIANDFNEALAIGKDMCEDRGYRYLGIKFIGDLSEINNMNVRGAINGN